MSIRIRFIIAIGVLSLLATVAISVVSYHFSVSSAMSEAQEKGQLVFDYLHASRLYFKKTQRPLIRQYLPRGHFVPELISGFTLTRGVWDEFKKKNKEYAFKQATIDPLQPENKADKHDMVIINYFRKHKDLKQTKGTMTKNGEPYFYFAKPIKVNNSCLHCHGDPANAPRAITERYGSENGYNWNINTIASAYIVYIPLKEALTKAKQSAVRLIAIGIVGMLIVMLFLWVFFSGFVVNPIYELEKRATEISLGKNLSTPIAITSNDEIGTLAKAVDRLRISVERMLQRFQNK